MNLKSSENKLITLLLLTLHYTTYTTIDDTDWTAKKKILLMSSDVYTPFTYT